MINADLYKHARNLNPCAEAIVAMLLWNTEYAAQRGGSMDFWDSRSEAEKRLCREKVDEILKAKRNKSWPYPPTPRQGRGR